MRPESNICRYSSWLVLFTLLLTSCAPTRTNIRVEGHETFGSMVYRKTFDEHGRPVFLLLTDRPTKTGERFSLVEFQGHRPSVSYEISIMNEPSRDYTKPVTNFMGNLLLSLGFGLVLGWIFVDDLANEEEPEYGDAFAAGFIIGTAGGLLYTGYKVGEDTSRLVINKMESEVSETYYNYDIQGRISSMLTIPPKGQGWESDTTKFFYEDDSAVPSRTETSHFPAEPREPIQP